MRSNQLLPIYLSVLLWHIGGGLVMTFTSLWLYHEIGESSFLKLGIVLSIPGLIGIFGISTISMYTDKKGRYRESILFINFIGALQYLFLTQITNSIQYLIIVGFGAFVFPAYYTIIQAYATNICEINRRGTVTSYLMLFASLGWFFGSLTSGIAFETIGMKVMLAFSSFAILISGIVILFAPTTVLESKNNYSKEENIQTSIWDIIKKKQIFYLTLSIIVLDFTAGAYFIFSTVFLYEKINMSSKLIGYANALATLSGTIILIKLGVISDSIGRKPIYLFGLIVYPVFFIALSIFHQVSVVFFLWSFPLYVFLRPTAPAMIADLTLENERSRGIGLITIASTLSMTLGAIFGGYLADTISYGMDIWTWIPATFSGLSFIIGYFAVNETLATNTLEQSNNL